MMQQNGANAFLATPPTMTMNENKVGRPKVVIDWDQVGQLLKDGFTLRGIAKLLGYNEHTFYKRIESEKKREGGGEVGHILPLRPLTDAELDEVIDHYTKGKPSLGRSTLRGILLGEYECKVSERRIMESLHRLHPEEVVVRYRRTIHRRVYNVPGPFHLWHIDGWHKINVTAKLVIHGGIDGYSRYVTYLRCSDSNDASTVLNGFISGCRECNFVPARCRSDYGTENFDVAKYVIQKRGERSMLFGPSTANQRIERFWRDMRQGCMEYYCRLFQYLQDCGFDIGRPLNRFVIHYLFMDLINEELEIFRQGWNHHKVRTMKKNDKNPIVCIKTQPHLYPPSVPVEYDNLSVINMIGRGPHIVEQPAGPPNILLPPGMGVLNGGGQGMDHEDDEDEDWWYYGVDGELFRPEEMEDYVERQDPSIVNLRSAPTPFLTPYEMHLLRDSLWIVPLTYSDSKDGHIVWINHTIDVVTYIVSCRNPHR